MKFVYLLLALITATAAFSGAARAAACAVTQPGFGFQDCAQISNKMVVSIPAIQVGSTSYTIEAALTFDNNAVAHLATGDKLCATYGGKKMLGFTYDDAGDEQAWSDLAAVSAKDGSFLSIDTNEYKLDTLTCSL